MKTKWIKYSVIYSISLFICIVLVYGVPTVKGALEKTYVAKHGEIEQSEEARAVVFRNETVYLTAVGGKVERLASNRELVRANQQIVTISGEGNEEFDEKYNSVKTGLGDYATMSENGVSTDAGYVSYAVDGVEYRLNSAGLQTLKKADVMSYSEAKTVATVSGKASIGEPIFKITANGDWWLVYYIKASDAKHYAEGNSINLEIGKETLTAKVSSVQKGKTSARIVLCCDEFVKNYLTVRTMDIKAITASAQGIVVDNDSIIEYKGNKGVLIKDKLGYKKFVRIGILADNGKQSAVYDSIFMDVEGNYVDTIKVYDEILKNPSKKSLKEATEAKESKDENK